MSLTSKDICELIKVCAKYRVAKLVHGELNIEFVFHDEKADETVKNVPMDFGGYANLLRAGVVTKESISEIKDEQASNEAVEAERERDRLVLMALEDPSMYEKYLRENGHDMDDDEVINDLDA